MKTKYEITASIKFLIRIDNEEKLDDKVVTDIVRDNIKQVTKMYSAEGYDISVCNRWQDFENTYAPDSFTLDIVGTE